MNTQAKLSILAAITILLGILAGVGLNVTGVQEEIDTLVANVTEGPSAPATEAQAASQTPVVVTVVVTLQEPSVTPENATPEPGATNTPYAGCDVTVRGDWNDFVMVYEGDESYINTENVISTIASGTVVHVDRLWIVESVEEEYSRAPLYNGWIRNNAFFPVYDLMDCWALPSNDTYPPTFAPTPGPTVTPVVDDLPCEVTPNDGLDYVNVRSGPGLWGYVVVQFPAGKTATWIADAGEWYQISYAGKSGYVASWVVEKSASCG